MILGRKVDGARLGATRGALARWASLAATLICLGVTALLLSPMLRGETYNDIASRQNEEFPWAATPVPFPHTLHYDQPNQLFPWQGFVNAALRAGELPLWNPYSFAGEPFFAAGNSYALYPPRTLLSLIVSPAHVTDVLTFVDMFLGGVLMYLLLARVPLGFPAAIFGAIAWMLNSFMLAWAITAVTILLPALPLAVLLVQRVLKDGSWAATLGLAALLALVLLGTGPLFFVLLLPVIGGYVGVVLLGRWLAERRSRGLRGVAGRIARDCTIWALPVLLAIGLGAVQLLPTAEVVRSVNRAPLTYAEYQSLSVPVEQLRYFFVPPLIRPPEPYGEPERVHDPLLRNLARDVLRLPYLNDPYHAMLFLGTPTALLAIVGLFARAALATFARCLAVAALLFVLGTPVTWLTYHLLPGVANLKPLGRLFFLFNFAAAILAAYGMELLLGALVRWSAGRWRAGYLAAARYGIAFLLATLVVIQMQYFAPQVTRHQPADPAYLLPATPLTEALAQDPDARFMPLSLEQDWSMYGPSPYGHTLYGSKSMSLGLRSANGYENLLPERIANLWRVVGQGLAPEEATGTKLYWTFAPAYVVSAVRYDLLPRSGVRYLVTRPDVASDPAWTPDLVQRAHLQSVYQGDDGMIYLVGGALPTAYLVAGCERVTTPAMALQRFADPGFDPTRAVIIEADFVGESASPCAPVDGQSASDERAGTAEIIGQTLNMLSVRVNAPRAAWLVVNESWDPGWRARVDGDPVAVVPGNYTFRALRVPAGSHVVELQYQSPAFLLGAAISGGALAVLVLASVWAVVRRRRAPGSASGLPTATV